MFTKLQQCSWIRKEFPHRCHVRDWYGLQEACGKNVLLYQTLTCWMKPFARVRTLMRVGHILTQPVSPVAKIVIIYDEGYCHFSACTGSCLLIYCFETWLCLPTGRASRILDDLNLFRSYVGPRPTVWFSCSAPMSEDVRHGFCRVCSPAVGACPTLFLM